MGKMIVIGSGLLAVATWLLGRLLLENIHSPLADFTVFLCLPFFAVIFLLSLFLVRTRRSSFSPRARIVFRGMRLLILLGAGVFLIAVFWPRAYGTPPMTKRAGTLYWDLPTGSRIAYTHIPAKSMKRPFPIIFLAGGPGGAIGEGNIQNLKPFAEDGYDIYLFDEVGCGWSDRLANVKDYTAGRHEKDLEAIVTQIGAEKIILLGHSWGAILAVLYVADNPGRVAQLILTGPGPIFPLRPGLEREPAPDSLHLRNPHYSNAQGNRLANNIRSRAMSWFAINFGVKIASDREADDFDGYMNGLVDRSTVADTANFKGGPIAGGGYYDGIMTYHSLLSVADPRPKLRNLPIPLLVLKGQYDNQKWGFTHEYLGLFPNHLLVVVPIAGHSISSEQPERFLTAVREFLKKNNP